MINNSLTTDELMLLAAIGRTHSLSKAAQALDISLPTASRQLAKARERLDNQLFVRSGFYMLPTVRMKKLLPEVDRILTQIQSVSLPEVFDPKTLKRTFTIAGIDNAAMTLILPAFEEIYRQAPDIRLNIVPMGPTLFEDLRSGAVDFAFYTFHEVDLPGDIQNKILFHSTQQLVVRKGHPLEQICEEKGAITKEELDRYRRIEITFSHGDSTALFGIGGAADGSDNVAMSLGYFMPGAFFVLQSDFVLVLTSLLAKLMAKHLPLYVIPHQIVALRAWEPRMIWHQRSHDDPASQWLRALISHHAKAFVNKVD